MTEEHYQIYSTGSIQIQCTCKTPDHTPKAVLFIVNGLGEHQGRYTEMADKFIENDIAVFTFDHRGHGKSDGKRGHADSIEQLVEDCEHAMMKCRRLFLDMPFFLFGQSMGGLVVAAYLDAMKSKEVSGAIISSPWIGLVDPPASWKINLVKRLSGIFPSITLPNGLDPVHISSVTEEVELYENDALIHNKISFSLFISSFAKGNYLKEHAESAKLPVLVCHGTDDHITSYDASVQYKKKLGANAAFKSWKDSRHEPHRDHEKGSVTSFYINWVLSLLLK